MLSGVLALWLAGAPTAAAEGREVDVHRLWDRRCAECHSHAGDFARKYLHVEDDRLVGRHPVRDVRKFLDKHYPPGDQVDAVYRMLKAQAATIPRFAAECGGCHGRAADFARESLVMREDQLHARAAGLPLAEFLASHRGLDASDVEFFTVLLERVEAEVNGRAD